MAASGDRLATAQYRITRLSRIKRLVMVGAGGVGKELQNSAGNVHRPRDTPFIVNLLLLWQVDEQGPLAHLFRHNHWIQGLHSCVGLGHHLTCGFARWCLLRTDSVCKMIDN